jgi:mRNA interferase YafQ
VKRCHKQQKKFKVISRLLEQGETLPTQNRDHVLTGNWREHRECHIAPDWLLIYEKNESEKIITFVRIGSHSELFG